jgi:hypothetical protein
VLPLQVEAAALAAGQGRRDLHAETCRRCVFEAGGQPNPVVMDGHPGAALRIRNDFNQDQTASTIAETMFDRIGDGFGNNERDAASG